MAAGPFAIPSWTVLGRRLNHHPQQILLGAWTGLLNAALTWYAVYVLFWTTPPTSIAGFPCPVAPVGRPISMLLWPAVGAVTAGLRGRGTAITQRGLRALGDRSRGRLLQHSPLLRAVADFARRQIATGRWRSSYTRRAFRGWRRTHASARTCTASLPSAVLTPGEARAAVGEPRQPAPPRLSKITASNGSAAPSR